MFKKKLRRLSAMLIAGAMAASMMGTVAFAEETNPAYQEQDVYILNHDGGYEGIPAYQYMSPYKGRGQFTLPNSVAFNLQGFVFNLYNPKTGEEIAAQCTDASVGLDSNSNYRRMNLEDSSYGAAAAGKLRSVVRNGFPNVSVEELGEAAGVENLTLCEAVTASQFAIWNTVHGDDLTFLKYFYTMTSDSKWDSPDDALSKLIKYYDECRAELDEYGSVDNPLIAEHIVAVLNYLTSLEPTDSTGTAVSAASFKEWSDAPLVVRNEGGTYDITVTATVDVEMTSADAMTLSAVLDGKTYFASTALSDGEDEYTLTIKDVPAEAARGAVTLAIDGNQTVSDVFLFDAEGERGVSQSLIGLDDSQLPVHAEVKVEPERIINFYKTTKIVTGQNAETGEATYTRIPLEGIKFDLYLAATLDEYLGGKELADPDKFEFPKRDGDNESAIPSFSVTTDAEGRASISLTKNDMPDGVYLVVEREHTAIKAPVAPFYVMIPYTNTSGNGWEYVVDIQPKNEVLGEVKIEKDVISVGNQDASVDAYAPHTWIIGSSIPLDIADGKEYKISDTLDNRLDFLNNVKVQVENTQEGTTIEPVVLAKDVDYKLTVVDNNSLAEGKPSDSFTIELTKVGMKKVASAADCDIIRVYFDAQINANAQMGENIENQAHLDYTNSVNFDFDADSDVPEVHTGGANLLKVNGKDTTKTLSGATFQVYRPATATEIALYNSTEVADDEKPAIEYIDGVSSPVILAAFYDNAELDGEKVTSATSDENGKVVIYGLAYGTYYLVETAAPEGFNLLTEAKEITIDADSHTEAAVVTVLNFGGFELPETGGIGTTIYTAMGTLMICAAGAYIILSKKRVVC